MKLFEIGLVSIGVSFDIFARIICLSSSYARIDYKKMISHIGAFLLWELAALCAGFYSVEGLLIAGATERESTEMKLMAIIILAVLTFRMLSMGIRGERVTESRRDRVSFADVLKSGIAIAIRTYFIGVAFAACNTNLKFELLILLIVALFTIYLGLHVGYRYGYVFRNKAYFLGSAFLLGTDMSILLRFF